MGRVTITGLDALGQELEALLEQAPDSLRDLHERLGQMAKQEVDRQIAGSGLQDSAGKIRRWQVVSIGSKGGYAAVRPEKGQSGNNSPGAVTNYLEHGHKIRGRSTAGKGYRPRIKVADVNGYHFYQGAGAAVEAGALRMVEQWANELADRLEGN